jgi:pilus assembly protein CpaC
MTGNTLKARILSAVVGLLSIGGQLANAQTTSLEGQGLQLSLGESQVLQLAQPITRVAVGQPGIADFILLGPKELYVLGKAPGTTNLVMWNAGGKASTIRTQVSLNPAPLRELLQQVLPAEKNIEVLASGDALILKGVVSDVTAAETAYRLAAPPSPSDSDNSSGVGTGTESKDAKTSNKSGPRIINLLKIRSPQQVMLEVRVAEVTKSYLETMGIEWGQTGGLTQGSLMTGFVSNSTLSLLFGRGTAQTVDPKGQPLYSNRASTLNVEAERKDGWVKILAEPTIVAMSGQEGSFLVGGKIFIPVNQALGSTTYEERSYGVGLRFVPTVLESGRINLKVAPEISEPVKESVTAGTAASLPAFTSSYVSTTVQMSPGENLVIGGLLKDNINEIVRAIPVLGEIPVLGAMFRRTQYITERTELLIVVRPTMVKASTDVPALPTDTFKPPSRQEIMMGGQLQGQTKPKP